MAVRLTALEIKYLVGRFVMELLGICIPSAIVTILGCYIQLLEEL
jgi:hypothetical protein